MSGIAKLLTAGGGGVSLTPASSIASDVTVNVPSQNCTLGIQGPAFSAYMGSSQSISNGVWTKAQFNTEVYDTASCYDPSTNYRFTPNVAGYYQVNATLSISCSAIPSGYGVAVYKNGVPQIYFYTAQSATYATGDVYPFASYIVYLNGSTDYVEIYGYAAGTSPNLQNTSSQSLFQAVLVRGE